MKIQDKCNRRKCGRTLKLHFDSFIQSRTPDFSEIQFENVLNPLTCSWPAHTVYLLMVTVLEVFHERYSALWAVQPEQLKVMEMEKLSLPLYLWLLAINHSLTGAKTLSISLNMYLSLLASCRRRQRSIIYPNVLRSMCECIMKFHVTSSLSPHQSKKMGYMCGAKPVHSWQTQTHPSVIHSGMPSIVQKCKA